MENDKEEDVVRPYEERLDEITDNVKRQRKVLGQEPFKINKKFVCFLPYIGEFGWYIVTHVKRVHGFEHSNKIVFCKRGHECLFPTASHFEYDWEDVEDRFKAGCIPNDKEEILKQKIIDKYGDDVEFLKHTDASWEEKISLANIGFIPENKNNLGLNVDIVITPRNRRVDPIRNWDINNWQHFVNKITAAGYTVGVCGARETSYSLDNIKHKSFEHIDIDSDVEMMRSAKLVITQESGLLYVAYLCKSPVFIIDHYLRDYGSDLQRHGSFMREIGEIVWNSPERLFHEVINYLEPESERKNMNKTKDEIILKIDIVINKILIDKNQSAEIEVKLESNILDDFGIDSLDLALLVRELEEFAGFDPFADGFINFTTVEELANLYVK